MPIVDLFSKRQKRLRGELPDVYQYEEILGELRVQIIQIFNDIFGDPQHASTTSRAFELLHQILCREYGRFTLSEAWRNGPKADVFDFILKAPTEEVLDIVETGIGVVREFAPEWDFQYPRRVLTTDQGVDELNARFREHGVGYEVVSGLVVRVDSQILHQEAVRPALQLLAQVPFGPANDEFLNAHRHYREGRFKECIAECLKTLESVLKIICTKRGWEFSERDTVSKLLDLVFSNGLLPTALQSEFASLRATLEGGIPTVRNRLAGHGQGATRIEVPEYLSAYLLHLTAASVLLLVRAHDA